MMVCLEIWKRFLKLCGLFKSVLCLSSCWKGFILFVMLNVYEIWLIKFKLKVYVSDVLRGLEIYDCFEVFCIGMNKVCIVNSVLCKYIFFWIEGNVILFVNI